MPLVFQPASQPTSRAAAQSAMVTGPNFGAFRTMLNAQILAAESRIHSAYVMERDQRPPSPLSSYGCKTFAYDWIKPSR